MGSVTVAQAVVQQISTNRLFGLVPLPLEVCPFMKLAFSPFDVFDPIYAVG